MEKFFKAIKVKDRLKMKIYLGKEKKEGQVGCEIEWLFDLKFDVSKQWSTYNDCCGQVEFCSYGKLWVFSFNSVENW